MLYYKNSYNISITLSVINSNSRSNYSIMNEKKIFILLLLVVSLIFIDCGNNNSASDITTDPIINNTTKTSGTLSVSTLTSSAGGKYAPKNIVAIWVESSSGTYVKTLLAYANTYKRYLTNWSSSSGYNTTDAVTGATVNSHTTRSCSWNGKDYNGNVVGDGTYKVCMELTDKDGTGNYHEFTFTKGTSSATLSPSNVSSFSNISIKWTPN